MTSLSKTRQSTRKSKTKFGKLLKVGNGQLPKGKSGRSRKKRNMQINQFPEIATSVGSNDRFGFDADNGNGTFTTKQVAQSVFRDSLGLSPVIFRVKTADTVREYDAGNTSLDPDLQLSLQGGKSYVVQARYLFKPTAAINFTSLIPKFGWSLPAVNYAIRDAELYSRNANTGFLNSFGPSSVDPVGDTISFNVGPYVIGTRVRFLPQVTSVLPGGLEQNTDYFMRRNGLFTFQFFRTYAQALTNDVNGLVGLDDAGTGTNFIIIQESGTYSTAYETSAYSTLLGSVEEILKVTERWVIQPSADGVFGITWGPDGELANINPGDTISLLAGSHFIVYQA